MEEDIGDEQIIAVAKMMLIADRTAPKGSGVDNTVMALVLKNDIKKLSDRMCEMVDKEGVPQFFARETGNILHSLALVLIGTKIAPLNLNPCGLCSFGDCNGKRKHADAPCAFSV